MKSLQSVASRPTLRNVTVFALDLAVAAISFVAAYFTVLGMNLTLMVPGFGDKLLGFSLSAAFAFALFRQHRGTWRYVSVPDLIYILQSSALAVAAYTVGIFLWTRGEYVPRSVVVLTFIFLVCGLAGMRLLYRIGFEQFTMGFSGAGRASSGARRHVLLCGFSDEAESFIRSWRRPSGIDFEIVGILDDSNLNHGRTVQGIKVIGGLDDLPAIIERLERRGVAINEIVVTESTPGRKRLAHIMERANRHSIRVSRLPDFGDAATLTPDTLLQPRALELGDLLERPEVKADLEGVAALISDRVVLATGAGGSIGSELCRQIAAFRPRLLVITDSSEFHLYRLEMELRDKHPKLEILPRLVDVRDIARVRQCMDDHRPDVVFHAAALKHVPMAETNPIEAIKTNVLGTRNVADAALEAGCSSFVMISTDKAVNPTNVMGATKRVAESYCQALDVMSQTTRFKTVRFGNVLGSNGSVVPRFQEQIAAGGPVTVTHPQIVRYFMTIPEAVRLVLHACGHALSHQTERGKIMVLDMGKPVRIVDLAERIIQLAGYKPRIDIDIVFTGLRPGEKLYEELFDPSEVQNGRTEEGYVIAAPRIVDRVILTRTLGELESCIEREDATRAIQLLKHLVPEYKTTPHAPRSKVGDQSKRP